MKRISMVWMSGWLLACMAGIAQAGTAQDVRKTAEAGMVVTGTVEVNPDGSLHGYALDTPEKLPPSVVDVVGKTVNAWVFHLSGPSQDVVKTKMNLRVVAKPVGDGQFAVAVQGASFGTPGELGYQVSGKDRSPPAYPREAINARVSGTVYLVLRIGRDGTVQEAIAEQVNLDQYDREAGMVRYRKLLADASLAAARQWTFNLPTKGPEVDNPYWVARVPVNFNLRAWGAPPARHDYGQWDAYIPGPRQTPPWIGKALANESPDAVVGDGLRTGEQRLQLVTPVGGA
ncbi:energy transducer TonB [Dyella telluris]|uniref:Energy transducer TonB n=1 Tax=Dyella telluris TaxID=2763498 RepID=A0A7G8Q897_9GAMM|nr:energy transducer TonB [Dyella telluris]QNK03005.1 energy transducer TonB [Dyella telluris]